MRNFSTSIAAALLLMAGCLGDFEVEDPGSGGNPSGESAEALFADLHTQLNAECALCHADGNAVTGPDYQSTASASQNLADIMAYRSEIDGQPIVGNSPENSRLYITGAHTGPAMTPALAAKVEAWIIAQAEENGSTPPDGEDPLPGGQDEPKTLVEALTVFAGCMAFTDFEATNFGDVANQNTAEGQCYTCHDSGTGGASLNIQDATFFTRQKDRPFILKFATGTVTELGGFDDLIPSDRYELKRDDNGHPNYILSAARIESIDSFFNLTYTRYRTAIDTGTPCVADLPPPPQ
jgi:hypothetical protein